MTAEATTEVTTPVEEWKGPFHLEIHSWLENQQTTHGVRHEDYAQYQKYCTNRLKRLSHNPDVKRYLVCSSKYAAKDTTTGATTATTEGGGGGGGKSSKPRHAYASRKMELLEAFATGTSSTRTNSSSGDNKNDDDDADDNNESQQQQLNTKQKVPHENILWYFLVLSERAWACAKGKRHQTTNTDTTAKRSQILKKYKKAKDWAQILVDIAKSGDNVDDATLQECEAYLAWMKGNYALEKLDYMTSIQEFANAMTLCHKLSQVSVESTSAPAEGEEDNKEETRRLERQDLFLTRADTLLRPLFRYCQYELKQAGEAIPIEEPQLSSTGGTGSKPQGDDDDVAVNFRGCDLVVENKDLRVLLLKFQSLEQQHQQQQQESSQNKNNSSEKSFLEILSVLDDATDVVSKALQGYDQAAVIGPTIQAKKNNLLAWKGYLQSQKTQHVMDHTQELLKDIEGHAERVHVYDALLQHATSLLALPKVVTTTSIEGGDNNDGDGDIDEEDEFVLQVQANCLRLRALKCYHMAWYYYEQAQKYGAALGLLRQANKLSKRALEEIAACDDDMPHGDEYMEELEGLPLSSLEGSIKAAMYLQQGLVGSNGGGSAVAAAAATKSTNRPLLLRLHENDGGLVMADITLPMPIFSKPIFFDIAYDYAMDTRDSVDKVQDFVDEHTIDPEEEKEEPSTSGSSQCQIQ